MVGKPAFTFPFRRKDKVRTLGETSAVTVAPDLTTESGLLFERFLVVTKTGELSLEEVIGYELSSFFPALFESRNICRMANKPQHAYAIS